MRPRKSLWLTALAGLSLALPSCRDGVTDPAGRSPDQVPAPLASVVAEADPVTVTHSDGLYREFSFTVANNEPGLDIGTPGRRVMATVPLFDPSLGELISARLVIEVWLAAAMRAHGVNPFYVSNDHIGGFTAQAEFDPLLTSLTGQSHIRLNQSYDEFLEAIGKVEDGLVAWGRAYPQR